MNTKKNYNFINPLKFLNFADFIFFLVLVFGIFLISILELLFFSTLQLLLSDKISISNNFVIYINFLENFLQNFFNFQKQNSLLLILCLFLIFKNIIYISHNYFQNYFIYSTYVKKSVELAQSYLNQRYLDFYKNNLSYYLKNIILESKNIFLKNLNSYITLIFELIYLGIIFYYIFNNFNTELLVRKELLIFLFYVVVVYGISKLAGNIGVKRENNEREVFLSVSNILSFFKEINVFNKSSFFLSDLHNKFKKFIGNEIKFYFLANIPKPVLEIFLLLFIYLTFKNLTLSFEKFIISFTLFAVLIIRVVPSFGRIVRSLNDIIYYSISSGILLNTFKKQNNFFFTKQKKKINLISIKNLIFKYFNKNIIKNFSYTFQKGKIYLIKGKSGSGKTTLLSLICGFIQPQSGTFIYNKKEIINFKKLSNYSFYQRYKISYMSQESYILDSDVISNVSLELNNSKKNFLLVKKILLELKLDYLLESSKIHNNLSPNKLSGGEKQRINFARIMFADQDLILLDEPTSSLDQENEKIISNYLNKIKKNKIIIINSHKSIPLLKVDKIINL